MGETPLQEVYRKSAEITPSYSYDSILSGVQMQLFYPCEGTDVNLLSTQAIFSNERVKNVAIDDLDNVWTKKIDQDFDVEFNSPRIIKGMSIVSVPIGINAVTAGKQHSAYVIAKIRKYSAAGVESEIANNQSDTLIKVGTAQKSKVMCIEIDTPRTEFAIGDKLRLTLELWAHNSDTASDGDAGR